MPIIPYDAEWLKRHGYDPALAGLDDRDPRWLAAYTAKRQARESRPRTLPVQRIPDDFDAEKERQRMQQGGCCH